MRQDRLHQGRRGDDSAGSGQRHADSWRRPLSVAWIAVVAALTLTGQTQVGAAHPSLCMICGSRGMADAVLNFLLFVPLGLLLASPTNPVRRAFLSGLAFSLLIETAQFVLPGRDPTLRDVLANALGAGCGGLLASASKVGYRRFRPLAATAIGIATGTAVLLGGWLMTVDLPDLTYWGQTAPRLGHLESFSGRVASAWLNGRVWRTGRIPQGSPVYEELRQDWTIRATLVLGNRVTGLAPVLSVFDDREREILLLGVDGSDLVLRERTKATGFRLDQPDVRLHDGLLAHADGDSVVIVAARRGAQRCLGVEEELHCGLGVTPGRLWGLFLYPLGISHGARTLFDMIFVAAAFFAIGFTSARVGLTALNGVLVVSLSALGVMLGPLTPSPPAEVLSALVGLVVGLAVARITWRAEEPVACG